MGRAVDKLIPWHATLFAVSMTLCFLAIQTGAGNLNVAAVIITTIGLDVFIQMIQVSLTTSIFG